MILPVNKLFKEDLMRVYPISKSKKLCILCNTLTRIINSLDFENILTSIDSFDYDFDPDDGEVDGRDIISMFKSCPWDARIKLYKPFWLWSKVLGYYKPNEDFERIYINKRMFYKRDDKSCAKTMLHEIIHLVDNYDTVRRFGHGDNSPYGKEESAPWKISNIVIDELFDKFKC
jgi:hypothetical protein